MNYTIHRIFQARILESVAFPFSRGSSQPRDRTQVSCIAGRFLTNWAIRESQFPRKVVPKNILPIGQLHSSPMLVRSHLISCIRGFSIMWTKNFQISKLGLEKEEKPEIKLPTFVGSQRKLGKSRKTSACFIDYAKACDSVDHSKMWEAFKQMGIPGHLICLLRNLYAGQEAIARTLYGTIDSFKVQKGVQHGCLLSPCLFNLYASTSWETLGWMSNKLETR